MAQLDVLEFNSCKRRLIDVMSLFSPSWQNGEPGSNYEKATVAHAKRIMKPFVLRRLKKDVSILIWTQLSLIFAGKVYVSLLEGGIVRKREQNLQGSVSTFYRLGQQRFLFFSVVLLDKEMSWIAEPLRKLSAEVKIECLK